MTYEKIFERMTKVIEHNEDYSGFGKVDYINEAKQIVEELKDIAELKVNRKGFITIIKLLNTETNKFEKYSDTNEDSIHF